MECTETARLGTYAPRRPGKVSEHPMAPEAGSEAGAAKVNQAGSCSDSGECDHDDQGRPTLPVGDVDHVSSSWAPELWWPPGASLSCDHVPPLDRIPLSLPSWGTASLPLGLSRGLWVGRAGTGSFLLWP